MEKTNHFFWGEIAPSDHLLQIFETDKAFISALYSYVSEGIDKGETVIIIGTEDHLKSLNLILNTYYDTNELINTQKYLPIDAEKLLDRILLNDEISEDNFRVVIEEILSSVKNTENSRTRILGEMVALLWGMGYRKATIKLEKLWSSFCSSNNISLFCAYPQSGFRQDAVKSIQHICSFYSRFEEKNKTESEMLIYGEKFRIGAA